MDDREKQSQIVIIKICGQMQSSRLIILLLTVFNFSGEGGQAIFSC